MDEIEQARIELRAEIRALIQKADSIIVWVTSDDAQLKGDCLLRNHLSSAYHAHDTARFIA